MPAVGSSRQYPEVIEDVHDLGERVTTLEEAPNSWIKVAEIDVKSPVSEIAVEDLDLEADGPYSMILALVNPTDELVTYSIHFNDDDEPTHYWWQSLLMEGTVVTALRTNNPTLRNIWAGGSALMEVTLVRGPDGIVRYHIHGNRGEPADISVYLKYLIWTVPDNVTKIALKASVAGGLGVGSRLLLHRLK